MLIAFVIGFWFFVPLHEWLHVLGCWASGGRVTHLEISPLFGGDLFARIFPWVTSDSEYAGRLSGFRPAGDLSYLVTVLAPLVVLCAVGSALARSAARKRQPWLFGFSLSAALQPLAALNGDCYEAASIPLTRLASLAGLDWALRLRGDDLSKVAAQAAAVHSPLAWALLAAGCLGGVIIAAATLTAAGGVAPRPARSDSQRLSIHWSRRSLVRAVCGAVLIGAGSWILKRVYFPRHLASPERQTMSALLDTILPDTTFPGAPRTGFLDRLVRECDSKRQTRRALVEGLEFLDSEARKHGAHNFVNLDPTQRATVLEACAAAAAGTLPQFFYRMVRDRALQLHYSHPVTWPPRGFSHPPQPEGYLNYRQPPDA